MWPELAISRDGISWSRPFEGQPLISTGPVGSADSLQIRMSSSIVEMDDEIIFFYGQTNRGHISDMRVEVGMATMRLDGFVAMEAGDEAGGIYTKPFLLEGNRIFINAAANGDKDGWIRVGVLDENGTAIPGFSNQLCVPITGDGVRLPVEWTGDASLESLRGQPVHLLFQLRNASLYSFTVADDPIPGDANRDGRVDGSDVTILAGNWQVLTDAIWNMGDFNGDGKVDGSDVTILAGNWQCGVSTVAASVPEPSTTILCTTLTICVLLLQSSKNYCN